ncbi:MAG: Eco57I restriction-modification methylase domain-containing protein [Acinetobacter radioresistens]
MSLILLKKEMGQVFTPKNVADLLAAEVSHIQNNFNTILDMGAGIGILTKSILNRNMAKSYELVEKDVDLFDILEGDKELILTKKYNIDILDFDFKKYDLVISNPPFIQIQYNMKKEYGDIVFFEYMWEKISDGAVFSFIVTNNIINNYRYKKIREKILSETAYLSVVELDMFIYSKTEVQSFIITGKKSNNVGNLVVLKKSNKYGDLVDFLEVDKNVALNRMDLSYYRAINNIMNNVKKDLPLLSDLSPYISRGSKSNNFFIENGIKAFHTTHFSKNKNNLVFDGEMKSLSYKSIEKGDIIIPRVGSRCLNYCAYVENGNSYFTDCIYRIQVESKFHQILLNSLRSPEGILWRQTSATGSCAKHITLKTLKNMPIFSN